MQDKQQNSMVQTSFDSGYGMHSYMNKQANEGKREALIGEVYKKQVGGAAPPQVTVINADSEPLNNSMSAKPSGGANSNGSAGGSSFLGGTRPIISGAPSPRQLSRQVKYEYRNTNTGEIQIQIRHIRGRR